MDQKPRVIFFSNLKAYAAAREQFQRAAQSHADLPPLPVMISDTGRISAYAQDVVQTAAFKEQLAAVARLRKVLN